MSASVVTAPAALMSVVQRLTYGDGDGQRFLLTKWLLASEAFRHVTAVDQFKWTAHVETVAIFRR